MMFSKLQEGTKTWSKSKKKSQVLEPQVFNSIIKDQQTICIFLIHNYYSVFRTPGFLFKREVNAGIMICK